MNAPLLRRVREAGGLHVPLGTLAELSQDPVRDLDELEAFGFSFERHPILGVAFRAPSARLCPDQIEDGLATDCVGRRVAVWNRVASTNDLAARAAGSSANEGLVILADEQTAGRGRRGRAWVVPPRSSILMSLLLFPKGPLADSAWLTALGAVAVAELVRDWTGADARIKWPNDVRVGGRKIAGVLVERGPGAVIGIGLNANVGPDDLPAEIAGSSTSMQILLGGIVDRSELAADLIRSLDRLYLDARRLGPLPLAASWRALSEHIGKHARVLLREGEVIGRVTDLDLLGGLTLVGPDDTPRSYPGSDVVSVSTL